MATLLEGMGLPMEAAASGSIPTDRLPTMAIFRCLGGAGMLTVCNQQDNGGFGVLKTARVQSKSRLRDCKGNHAKKDREVVMTSNFDNLEGH